MVCYKNKIKMLITKIEINIQINVIIEYYFNEIRTYKRNI